MKRALVALVLTCLVAAASACSSRTSTSGGSFVQAEQVTPPNGSQCEGPCCTRPEPGSACSGAADAGVTCTWARACEGGLVTAEVTACSSGTWTVTEGACPPAGGVDDRGCPAEQPAPGAACTGTSGTCGYVIACPASSCDAGSSCATAASATATCVDGKWQTTPLSC